MSGEQIFSLSLWIIFSFFQECLYKADAFNFNKVQFINFSMMNFTFGGISKKALPNTRSLRLSLMLSSKQFVALYLTIRSVIHFKLPFMKSIRSVSIFTFLCIDIQLFQNPLLKRLYFLHQIYSALLADPLIISVWIYFWSPYWVPLIYFCILPSIPHFLITATL